VLNEFRRSRLYLMARESRRAISEELAARQSARRLVISLRSKRPTGQQALLCFRPGPFHDVQRGLAPNVTHPIDWLSFQMGNTFLDLGYDVDVISQSNDVFWPRKPYALVLDVRRVLQRIAPLLEPTCARIVHLDTAHMLFHDAAEARRLLNLQRRRGVTLAAMRFDLPTQALENADCGTTSGHEFTLGTYRYTGKPIHRLPIPSAITPAWRDKDVDACRRSFLFLASHGLVHKGLDLVLEAFASTPDLHLIVCGPLDGEPAFVEAYRRELFELPNIQTIGWVDVRSDRFLQIADRCIAMILPSCAEGAATSPVEAMHAGLIPIVTYETSVEVGDFGIMLKSDAIEDIRTAAMTIAELPVADLNARARAAWEYARAHHTKPRFAQVFRQTVEAVVASRC
jgi:glycosyltransferase involved in cell wall biosynthesis